MKGSKTRAPVLNLSVIDEIRVIDIGGWPAQYKIEKQTWISTSDPEV